MNDMTTITNDKLMNDLKVVVEDAEALMRSTAGKTGESVADARARLHTQMAQAKEDLLHMQQASTARVKALGQNTNAYVHANPWTSIGIAASVGVMVGLLAARR